MSTTILYSLSVVVFVASWFATTAFDFKSDDLEEAKRYVESIDQRPASRIEPIPVFYPKTSLSFGEVRNPFILKKSEAGQKFINPDSLPAVDQNLVKLVPNDLLLLDSTDEHALIKLPDGAVYKVGIGDTLWHGQIRVELVSSRFIEVFFLNDTAKGYAATIRPNSIAKDSVAR